MSKIIALWMFCISLLIAETFSDKGFALSGNIKYKTLKHFDYVNPNAPKKGHIKLYAIGNYDDLNPFTQNKAAGIELIYDTLSVRSEDEPFSEYGLIAERIQRDSKNRFVIFHLNQEAKFHDGSEVSAFDVAFSFQMAVESKHPFFELYYQDVENVVVVDKWTIRFNFKNHKNKELPFILGQIKILPKKFYDQKHDESALPLGSGPYKIKQIEADKTIVYELAENYWAKNHPTRLGQFNFKTVTYEYVKDDRLALKAFNTGLYDYREEHNARNWAKGYHPTFLKNKMIQQKEHNHSLPSGMQGYFFNTRKEIFQDIAVREALSYAFDFEWMNKNLFYSQYSRTKSYFDNSPLASFGIPLDKEKIILEPFKNHLPKKIFESPFEIPTSTHKAQSFKKATELLQQAGWKKVKGKLTKNGKPFSFTLIVDSIEQKRLSVPFQKNLSSLGIEMSIRVLPPSQYAKSLETFDYDMIIAHIPQSLFPGNEQNFFFSSESVDLAGSLNYAGINNPIIDHLITNIIESPSYEDVVDHVRVLDRILLWHFYVIPHFHHRSFRLAYWDKFDRPNITPLYGIGFWSWWINDEKEQRLIEINSNLRRTE